MIRELRRVREALSAVNAALIAASEAQVSPVTMGHLIDARDALRGERRFATVSRDARLAEVRAEAWAELEGAR